MALGVGENKIPLTVSNVGAGVLTKLPFYDFIAINATPLFAKARQSRK